MSVTENIYNKSIAIFRQRKDIHKIKIGKAVTQMDTITHKLEHALKLFFQNMDKERMVVKVNGEYLNHLRFVTTF